MRAAAVILVVERGGLNGHSGWGRRDSAACSLPIATAAAAVAAAAVVATAACSSPPPTFDASNRDRAREARAARRSLVCAALDLRFA